MSPGSAGSHGLAVQVAPPKVQYHLQMSTATKFARKATRFRVFDVDDRVVAILEIVSPGNKDTKSSFRSFLSKAYEFLSHGIHMLIVDPFPPPPHDPAGLHQAIGDELGIGSFPPSSGHQPLIAMSFDAANPCEAYAEPFEVGAPLPTMPLFLAQGWYVNVPLPLEVSYHASWASLPKILQDRVIHGHPANESTTTQA